MKSGGLKMNVNERKIAVVMGSDSDFALVKKCIAVLKEFEVEYEVVICSAHRTPEKAVQFAKTAEDRGIGVIIAAAGMAAHLPGVIAAYSTLPVIGIPINSSSFNGVDSLLSIVQMPPGVPVAGVAIDGVENAAILALQILAVDNLELREKLRKYKKNLALKVEEKNEKLKQILKDESI